MNRLNWSPDGDNTDRQRRPPCRRLARRGDPPGTLRVAAICAAIARLGRAGRRPPPLRRGAGGGFSPLRRGGGGVASRSAILHGHCHQKALVGVQGTTALRRIPRLDVRVLDTGCCGMAGSFGFEQSTTTLGGRARPTSSQRLAQYPGASVRCARNFVRHQIRRLGHPTGVASAGTCRRVDRHHGKKI